ncbi:MAG: CoA pyrophosphatase [Pseudomonadota bacterium]
MAKDSRRQEARNMAPQPGVDLDRLAARLRSWEVSQTSDYDLNPQITASLPPGRKLTPASVLLAVVERRRTPYLVLTRRAARLRNHAGQVALPGGKVDATDADAIAAALREAQEEVSLAPSHVEVLATLPAHETVTGFSITPVLGRVTGSFAAQPDAREVSEVFEVPLSHVLTRGHFRVEARQWQGHKRQFYTVPYGPYYIWGATARILRTLADLADAP